MTASLTGYAYTLPPTHVGGELAVYVYMENSNGDRIYTRATGDTVAEAVARAEDFANSHDDDYCMTEWEAA